MTFRTKNFILGLVVSMYGWEYGDEPDAGSQWVTKTYVYLKYGY